MHATLQVIRPYLVGEDLNQRPDGSPSRWVIDFRDWPEARAREYRAPFSRVETLVRPERAKSNRETYRRRWWQFAERVPGLYNAIADLERCDCVAVTSKVVQPMIVPTGIVLSGMVCVLAYDDFGHFGLLSSGIHREWAIERGSTMRQAGTRYAPTDCFETFPQPEPDVNANIAELGARLHERRSASMLNRQEGLTTTYNRVHDPEEASDDIVELRDIHVALDHAVRDAYGWTDLGFDHGFHETKFGTRFTFAPVPRQEVLDRLLELNHERYAKEVQQGLHGKPKPKRRVKAAPAGAMTLGFDGV